MATALVSALTGIAVKRDIAMTGEISLHGRSMPIGGLREKTMAAYTAGVKTVFIPKDNMRDLDEVEQIVKDNVAIVPVSSVDDILRMALVSDPFKCASGTTAVNIKAEECVSVRQ